MAYNPKILYPSAYPANGGSTLYIVPPATTTIVKNIVMTNTTSDDATLHLSVVPAAGSPSASNRVLSDHTVPANGINTDLSIVMPTGASLHATNNTNQAIVVTISGVEIS
jgi:hypothetical protein